MLSSISSGCLSSSIALFHFGTDHWRLRTSLPSLGLFHFGLANSLFVGAHACFVLRAGTPRLIVGFRADFGVLVRRDIPAEKSLSTTIQRPRQVVSRVVGSQAIVVPVDRAAGTGRSVYSFNESGTKLWALIEAGKGAAELAESLSADYGLSLSEAASDAQDFLTNLAHEGLIELIEGTEPAPVTPVIRISQ